MSTSRIEETHETPLSSEEVAHLQQSIMRQYTQAILVLKEFFDKQEQFHNETIGANIDQAFSKLLGSPSLSSEERQTLCYYQCLYFEIKSDLAENPFTTPKKLAKYQKTCEIFTGSAPAPNSTKYFLLAPKNKQKFMRIAVYYYRHSY